MKYKTSNITDVLKAVGSEVESKGWHVNSGGCAVYAIIVHDTLAKFGIKSELKNYSFFGRKKRNITRTTNSVMRNNTKYTVSDFNKLGVYMAHVRVLVRGHLVDSEVVIPKSSGSTYGGWNTIDNGKIHPDAMRTVANSADGWNDSFNRKHIPLMKKIIEDGITKGLAVKA